MTVIPETDTADAPTGYPHVVRRPGVVGGRPRIVGTRIPVWQIAALWRVGETVADILHAFPHITPAALHSALAYYWDHQPEVDAEITENQPEHVLGDASRRKKEPWP